MMNLCKDQTELTAGLLWDVKLAHVSHRLTCRWCDDHCMLPCADIRPCS